ncbi:very short patch repair endonuclease [Tenacibaculum singaporense]|uniref:very short patch repair endonuclease n=1 Tax=Tenacibaculum singaporense TaxID=2358479 RepID=UPI000F68091D|nr:DNA mismatch endonuclease Vsr [Tenacibaculum singaporense]RSC93102.1 DNA mismatch endonuclease Vsr [Tenacibaculum singaporense]
MSDVHSKKVRSYNMSQIKGKNTKPEMLVRKFLHSKGFRFRIHDKKLPGKPDIVLPKYKTIIEVQGCFWHGHKNCKYFVLPKTNREFWQNKIMNNINRDKVNIEKLKELGWNIIILWECQLKKDNIESSLNQLIVDLTSSKK